MNQLPFSHACHYGTMFVCDKCDFSSPIQVFNKPHDVKLYVKDVAEMIGFHATNIHPNLNGFQGYDTLDFTDAP